MTHSAVADRPRDARCTSTTWWQYGRDHAKKTTEETGTTTENDERLWSTTATEQRRCCHAIRDGRGQQQIRRR